MSAVRVQTAVKHIDARGMLLVYPIDNAREPPSLWYELHPRTKMRWEWDSGGDDRVANLWHLREQLSRSNKVVYTKWYRGRATFFSKPVFTAFLKLLNPELGDRSQLSHNARAILDALDDSSPLSTKQLKKITGLQGPMFNSEFQKSLKELWDRLLTVGFGEIDDGAFPSLAIGSTKLLFEEIWKDSRKLSTEDAYARVRELIPMTSPFMKYYLKLRSRALPLTKNA